jgi:hypothetical protein
MSLSTASIGAKAPSLPHNRLALPANVSPRTFYTGGVAPAVSTDFTDATPVITEIYMAEIFVPASCAVTGINVFNGSNATDSVKCALYDISGQIIASTADTQVSGTDAFQKHAFTQEFVSDNDTATAVSTPIILTGGTYYVACIYDGTTSRYNAHTIGSFGSGKLTGHVYATAFVSTGLTVAPPTTFTTALGPVAALY